MDGFVLQFPSPAPASARELCRRVVADHNQSPRHKHWAKSVERCQALIDRYSKRINELNQMIGRMRSIRVRPATWKAIHTEHDALCQKRDRAIRWMKKLAK